METFTLSKTGQAIQLPQNVLHYWKSKETAQKKITRAVVLQLLRERKISFSRAAELLGMPLHDLFDLASEYKIPYLHYQKGELEQEVNALKDSYQSKKI